jgi:biotin--protein ligase
LHTDQQVTILKQKETNCNTEEEEVEVKIVGIDEYGYLVVKDRTGYQFSVHDDGNSFDMMNGLIRPKF